MVDASKIINGLLKGGIDALGVSDVKGDCEVVFLRSTCISKVETVRFAGRSNSDVSMLQASNDAASRRQISL